MAKLLTFFVLAIGVLFTSSARADMVDFGMQTKACVGDKCESCDALKGICSGGYDTSEYCMGGCGGEESLISYLRPWHLAHYFYTPPKLSYTYNATFYVFRNNVWVPLSDVCWTVHPGEQVKAELDKTGEWIGQPGLFWDTPPVHFKDAFDWTGIDGCRQEDDMGTADANNLKIGWGKRIGIDRNQLMAPTIFKNPLVTLIADGFQCQGNICTAPNQTGDYNLTNIVAATEARQHYWDYAPLAADWSFNGLKGCIPKHAYSGVGIVNGEITNPTIFGYTGSLDSPELTSSPSYLSANKVTETFKGNDYQMSVVESLANVPEWRKVRPVSVKTPEEDLCQIVCPIDGSCPAGTNLNCPGCCGLDNYCNELCPNDPDCGVVPAGSCIVNRIKPSLNVNTVETNEEVKYQANVIGGSNPLGYTWQCDRNGGISDTHSSTSRSDDQSCSYPNEGSYEPRATYQYKDERGDTKSGECTNAQGVLINVSQGVKAATSCAIKFSPLDKVEIGDNVIATIKAFPDETDLNRYSVAWKVNGAIQPDRGYSIAKTADSAGTITFAASIKDKNGTALNCGQASVNVTEKVKWGQ